MSGAEHGLAKGLTMTSLSLMLLGCAGATSETVKPTVPSVSITARTLASTEVSIFRVGTTEEVAYSYRLLPDGDKGSAFVAIGQDALCPAVGDLTGLYHLVLENRPTPVGLREGQAEALASDLVIASCEKVR